MQASIKDMGAGGLFLAIGLFFAVDAWTNLSIGSATSMGPGFFPFGLGLLLCGFGAGILIKGLRTQAEPIGPVPWRGAVLLFAAILWFALAVDTLGALPALAGCAFLAAISPADATWRSAAAITVALTAFCVGVFLYALGLPYPLIGPWLGGN